MVEYINSNDDAGNLALFGGIAATAFAGGAALAYRATSPIYKDKNKEIAEAVAEPKNIVTKFDDNAGKNPANFRKGALRGSTLGLVSSSQREKGLSEMAQSVVDAATKRNTADLTERKGKMGEVAGILSDFGDSYQKGISSLGNDVDKASSLLSSLSPADATKQYLKDNPNSLLQEEDLVKRASRQANVPMSRQDLEAKNLEKYAELQQIAQANRATKQADRVALQNQWTKAADGYYNSDAYKKNARQERLNQKEVEHQIARDIQTHSRQAQNTAKAQARRGSKGKVGKVLQAIT